MAAASGQDHRQSVAEQFDSIDLHKPSTMPEVAQIQTPRLFNGFLKSYQAVKNKLHFDEIMKRDSKQNLMNLVMQFRKIQRLTEDQGILDSAKMRYNKSSF
eukprot:253292_1